MIGMAARSSVENPIDQHHWTRVVRRVTTSSLAFPANSKRLQGIGAVASRAPGKRLLGRKLTRKPTSGFRPPSAVLASDSAAGERLAGETAAGLELGPIDRGPLLRLNVFA